MLYRNMLFNRIFVGVDRMTLYPKRFEALYNAYKNVIDRDTLYIFYRLGYNDALKDCVGKFLDKEDLKNEKK